MRSIVRLVLPKTVGGLEADVIFINVDHHIKKCHFVTCGEMELEKYRNLSSSNKKIILAKVVFENTFTNELDNLFLLSL